MLSTASHNNTSIPHSVEAEEATIGSVLINPEVFFDLAVFLKADDFYVHRYRFVWNAIARLHGRRAPVDLLTVSDELERDGKLAEVGGTAFLTSLVNQVPTSLNAEAYGRIVHEHSVRRKLIAAANEIASLAYSANPIGDVTSRAVVELEKAVTDSMGTGLRHITVPFSVMYDQMAEASERGVAPGIPTRIGNLDTILNNLKVGMYVVAGRPGQGKTALKLSIAKNAAKQGFRTAFFSLEMPSEQILQRLTANETGVSLDKIISGQLTQGEWEKVNAAAETFENLPLFVDDTPAISPAQIEARCRRLIMQYGPLDLVVVDYLQIMSADDGKTSNRTEEVGAISRGLKNISRRLNVPVLVGAQLNRESEKEDRRPRLSDLRESGSIEAEADVVIFPFDDDGLETLIVAKHRNGPVGDAQAKFKKAITKFE